MQSRVPSGVSGISQTTTPRTPPCGRKAMWWSKACHPSMSPPSEGVTLIRHRLLDPRRRNLTPWLRRSRASCRTVSRLGLSLMRRFAALGREIDARSASTFRSPSSWVFKAPLSCPAAERYRHHQRGYLGTPDAGLRGTTAVSRSAFAEFHINITKCLPKTAELSYLSHKCFCKLAIRFSAPC